MNPTYRPDIDGLRAISVLLVLFFHAGFSYPSAGFIGVDIFFVISGYLITSGIKSGLEKGSFSFSQFFRKRLWRLQPVFLCLVVVTLIATTLTYLPEDYLKYSASLKWAAKLQSNVYFSNLKGGYFADDVSTMPLLHTWSLGIEWQWYLILPFLMYGVYHLLRIKKLSYWIFPLTVFMIIYSLYLTKHTELKHYYHFGARIFEMLIGSCLAAVQTRGVNRINIWVQSIIGLLALGLILYLASDKNIAHNYPNWPAVAVSLSGAVLIYLGGADKAGLTSRILSIKPFAFLGLISYSLYIWHWPVFALMRNIGISETIPVLLFCIVLSVVLAYLSWRFIEEPFRKKHTIALWKSALLLVVIPAVLASQGDRLNRKDEGFPQRFGKDYQKWIGQGGLADSWHLRLQSTCVLEPDTLILRCSNYLKNPQKRALILGDSHADHSFTFLDVFAQDKQVELISNTRGGCIMLPDIYKPIDSGDKYCRQESDQNYGKLNSEQYDYVVIAELWTRYIYDNAPQLAAQPNGEVSGEIGRQTIEKSLDKALAAISSAGSKPILIKNIYDPQLSNKYYLSKKPITKCKLKAMKLHQNNTNACDFTDNRDVDDYRQWLNKLFANMKEKYPDTQILDLSALQCINGICRTEIDGYPVYRDDEGHITEHAAELFAKEYLLHHNNPFDN